VTPLLFEPPTPPEGKSFGVGSSLDLRNDPDRDDDDDFLKPTWREMLRRCYHEECASYAAYGGLGVHVDPSWFDYGQFRRDAKRLPNWNLKKTFPEEYSLDKDILHASNRYGPKTAYWASREEQGLNTSTNRPFTARDPSGQLHLFRSVGEASRKFGLNLSAIHRCLNKKLHTHHGFSEFQYVYQDGKVLRTRVIDQLKQVIASIEIDPHSRRHLISLWNPGQTDEMALPPCHGIAIQFFCGNNRRISLHMYQRSCDLVLGAPFNIASYALLLSMIAQITGYDPGELVISYGDAHIYVNHLTQVDEQLSREPKPLPKLILDPSITDIDDFQFEHIRFEGYDPHPAIKADVAV
jgi:thymidylate synthase